MSSSRPCWTTGSAADKLFSPRPSLAVSAGALLPEVRNQGFQGERMIKLHQIAWSDAGTTTHYAFRCGDGRAARFR
jgi:hypothetical protein